MSWNSKNSASRLDDVSRRDFIAKMAKTCLGLGALPLIHPSMGFGASVGQGSTQDFGLRPSTAKRVIYLFMSGGMSHVDTFDTKPGTENQGPVETISTRADGVGISHYFPNLAHHMDKVLVLNSLQSTQGAHAQGRYFMHTSYELRGTIKHPSMGSWLSQVAGPLNKTLPAHVAVNNSAYMATSGFLESLHTPLSIGDPQAGLQNSKIHEDVGEEVFARRLARAQAMNKTFAESFDHKSVRGYSEMYEQAVSLMKSEDLNAFDISQEPEALRDAYGHNSFGQGCLLARRLVENDVRFVEVVSGGWDTHNDNFDSLNDLCPNVDRGLSALLADLSARGLLDETLVVLATEFGRTPEITDRTGRNHYPKAFSALMAGGGIVGGRRYGKTNETGSEIIENPVSVPDFNATIAYALGLPLEHEFFSPSGRPFKVADKGLPVLDLFHG